MASTVDRRFGPPSQAKDGSIFNKDELMERLDGKINVCEEDYNIVK